jgi:Ca-activated chloride channel homolog
MVKLRKSHLIVIGVLVVLASYGWQQLPSWARNPDYWWQTPNQRGAALYAEGDFAHAAQHFHNPAWRAAALYRARDWPAAEAAFAQLPDTAEQRFNRGNVAAHAGQLAQAVAHYDAALTQRPGWAHAIKNRQLVANEIAKRKRRPPEQDGGEPMLDPDGTVIDEQAQRGKPGRIDVEKLDPSALAALWLRTVRTDPGAFLRLRFAQEVRLGADKKATP